MRLAGILIAVVCLATFGFCANQSAAPAQTPAGLAPLPCTQTDPGASGCQPSAKDLKVAKAAFAQGLKLQSKQQNDEALDAFQTAARLAPRNVEYVTAHEVMRQQLVFEYLQRGSAFLSQGREVEAMADFRQAVELDPENQFAQQRLRDSLGEWAPKSLSPPRVVENSGVARAQPSDVRADVHYRGDSQGLLRQLGNAFGLSVVFDDSFGTRTVRFDLGSANFYDAMQVACTMTRSFWTALSPHQIFIAADTADNHRKFDRLALRTFYIPGATAPADLNNVANMLRSIFDIRLATPQPRSQTIVVRAPQKVLDAATNIMLGLDDSRPQVMLDLEVFEVNHSLTRNLGLQIPNQFKLFNIPAVALAALAGQNIQDLINQLISSGGINQANSTALSGLLAQLQGQNNSIFNTPLATFGNGTTLMGLSLGTVGAQLGLNETSLRNLEHATLRTAHGDNATFHMGTRVPILNATFAPIFNSAAISQVIQNNSFQAPFPSFNYEDLGLSIKAKPFVNAKSDVSLQLELTFRTLLGQSVNGVPVISNREFVGSIALRDGQPAVVAGSITHSQSLSLSGLPGFGNVPGVNRLMTSNTRQTEDDELLILITPRVVSLGNRQESLVWMPK